MKMEQERPDFKPVTITFQYPSEFAYFVSVIAKLKNSKIIHSVKHQVIIDKLYNAIKEIEKISLSEGKNDKFTIEV